MSSRRDFIQQTLLSAMGLSIGPFWRAGTFEETKPNKKQTNLKINHLRSNFRNPPESARPWVYWFWINGNISKEGITKDFEDLKKAGVGGVIWMGISGPDWAPKGAVEADSPEWHEAMQWAIQEADRLGLKFDLTVDYGYGCGGPHITPDRSMQRLLWSQTVIEGGRRIEKALKKPKVSKKNVEKASLRPGKQLSEKVKTDIENIDSYRDVSVIAIPYSSNDRKISRMVLRRVGLFMNKKTLFTDGSTMSPPEITAPSNTGIAEHEVINLTDKINANGILRWEAPLGKWRIVRYGYASNYKMTRPTPQAAVGLEANRLSKEGIDTHFEAHLKPIFERAGEKAGRTLKYVHVDSWEAGTQDWTDDFPEEFRKRRGYEIYPWLPVLTGRIVESPELSKRFLWDFRQTASELMLDNFARRLRDLAAKYDVQFSTEAYGIVCTDDLKYAGVSNFPIGEFWAATEGHFPDIRNRNIHTVKAMTSAAHTYGKPRAGAEAFTNQRGWRDHPYTLKGIGDQAFCEGVNCFILHTSVHQPYEQLKPGLTHRKFGGHFGRNNTWWSYSKPWFDYIKCCQYMLQQGRFMADVVYFFGEGAPIKTYDMAALDLPRGYDYDFCSSDIVHQMEVQNGKIVLPSGMTYNYLLLPNTDRLALSSMQKIKALIESGGRIIAQKRIIATPGLSEYPEANQKVKRIADQLWEQGAIITESKWHKIFQKNKILPDFKGNGLNYIHRKTADADIYFVANPEPSATNVDCSFRISGKVPELWNPETGVVRELPEYTVSGGRITIPLRFDPMQSWFIVFRKTAPAASLTGKNFPQYHPVKKISGPWQVSFDPDWGGPEKAVTFNTLQDWTKRTKTGIRYYSGTAIYRKSFDFPSSDFENLAPILLDLGQLYVMARVIVNGKNCGIAWKPPYRVDISEAVQPGKNELKIEVVNLWINRMIGDEQRPEDSKWIDWETLKGWPDWFLKDDIPRTSGRYTFATVKYYDKDDPLAPSGLIGPVRIYKQTSFSN